VRGLKQTPPDKNETVLVHLASGIGNIVFATPLLIALSEMRLTIDVRLDADYKQTAELLEGWSIVREILCGTSPNLDSYDYILPAIPPFYWPRFQHLYKTARKKVCRPLDSLFYENEQAYYLRFAHTLGYPLERSPYYCLPIAPSNRFEVKPTTLIIAPGCKTGEMALKRWAYFPELAERFDDVILIGTEDDLRDAQGCFFHFPSHVRSYVSQLSLRESAEFLAGAGAVVGNDSGLCHIAGAVGTPTLVLFGPTPDKTLGHFPENVRVLRAGLPCEPCWFSKRFGYCKRRIDCLTQLSVDKVETAVRSLLGQPREDQAAAVQRKLCRTIESVEIGHVLDREIGR
jgi:ADP-heptose:LPS heptosyltransferase